MALRGNAHEVVCHGALFVIAVAGGVDIRKQHHDRTRRVKLVDERDIARRNNDRARGVIEGC